MRVLFITHAFAPHFELGGPAYSVTELAKTLGRRGVNVRVLFFTPNASGMEAEGITHENVDVIHVKPKSGMLEQLASSVGPGFRFVANLETLLRDEVANSDVVHVHLGFIYPGFVAMKVAKKLCKPLIYHPRGNLHPNRMRFGALKKNLYYWIFERSILSYAKFVIALNEVEKAVLANFVSFDKVRVIPNGIDFSGGDFRFARREIGIEPFQLLYLGRLDRSKGIDVAIRTLRLLRNQGFNREFHLNIAGTGQDAYGTELEHLARELGVSDCVTFHGHLSGRKKIDLIGSSHLFVLPSEAEGLSIAILEALASNLPLLITKECGFEEEIEGGAGLYCDKNPASIAEKVVEIKRQYHLYSASRIFEERRGKYSWEEIGESMVNVYRAAQEDGAG